MNLGREEGYTVAKEAFDTIVEGLKAREVTKARTLVENGVDARLAPTAAVSTQSTALIVTATLTTSTSTQTDPPAAATSSISTQTNPTTSAATSQTSEPFENEEHPKFGITSETLPRSIEISPPTIASKSPTPAPTTTALEMRLEITDYAQKLGKVENSAHYSKNSTNFGDFSSPTPSPFAHNSTGSSTTITACETHPKSADFSQKHEKVEKSPNSDSEHLNWGDDSGTLPITPTFPQNVPRDLSCLRSTSAHPFSSLRRRCSCPKKRWNTRYHHSHGHYPGYSYTNRWHHSSGPYTPSSTSLNWDQDPRLFDLSNALRALGWVRR